MVVLDFVKSYVFFAAGNKRVGKNVIKSQRYNVKV
jgi:hypothetical protein